MYKPLFNSVLVEIDDKDAKWGTGNDDAVLSQSYRMGKAIAFGDIIPTADYPNPPPAVHVYVNLNRDILWNEGHEAGTVFEEDGKQYAFIYWWDIRGVKESIDPRDIEKIGYQRKAGH